MASIVMESGTCKRRFVALALSLTATVAVAEVDVSALLNESAMWLDASKPASFQLNENGGVTNWINQSAAGRAAYGDAEAYLVDTTVSPTGGIVRCGNVSRRNGVPVYEMKGVGSEIDLRYREISTIRAVFFVGEFLAASDLAPFLGHSEVCHFHRGASGAFWNSRYSDDVDGWKGVVTVYQNSATATVNAESGKPRGTSRDILIFTTSQNAKSDQLARDRNYLRERTGARSLSEVIIFTRELSAEERTAVYDYLDAKWNQGGWNTGAYAPVAADFPNWGGMDAPAFTADATVGQTTDASRWWLAQSVTVASGATATINTPMFGGNVGLTGGGTLAFAGGANLTGELTQGGGTLNLGGGAMDVYANPVLSGNVRWENGTYLLNYYGEFRPASGVSLTLGDGARVIKDRYWRTFIDKGMTLTLETGSYMEVLGPMCVGCDFKADNSLNINGGTLVVTNCSEQSAAAAVSGSSLNIMTQKQGGTATLTIESGRIVTTKLRVAADWHTYGTGVNGTGTVNVNGGAIETLDCVEVGSTHASQIGTAYVNFNGGEVTAPNGVRFYRDDHDTLVFNGTVFHATADSEKYIDLRRNAGTKTSVDAGGLILDVADGKSVTLGWGLAGAGGIVKRGTGRLVLDKAATFAGGVTVEAGEVELLDAAATGTGTLRTRAGTVLKLGLVRPAAIAIALASGTAIDVTVTAAGLNEIAPTAEDMTSADGIQVTARDVNGTVLSPVSATIANGKFCVLVPETYLATAADATANWYGLPWTQAGVSVSFPTETGRAVSAQVTVSGTSAIALDQQVNVVDATFVNGGETPAATTLAGPAALAANLDLSGYVGDFAVRTDVTGGITVGANATLSLFAAADETWSAPRNYAVSGAGVYRKTGAGTVVLPELPTGRAIDLQEGTLAVKVDEDVTSTAATVFTNTQQADAAFEKRGEGTLTVTAGTFVGQVKVAEGLLKLDGPFQGITATAERPLYVGPNGSLYIQGSQVNNRLPSNAAVLVDGGVFTLSHVNPAPENITIEVVNGGTFIDDHTRGKEHQKFSTLTLTDSTWRFTGTQEAYGKNGCYMVAPCTITVNGTCVFEKEAGNPNQITGAKDITLNVTEGARLSMGLPFMKNVSKTGPGTVRFTDGASNATATFTLNSGVLENGGTCPNLSLAAGSTLKAVEGGPLAVTTLTLPSAGFVRLDLSGIDFTNRTEPLRILTCSSFTAASLEKFEIVGMPDAPWQIETAGGMALKRAPQPVALAWDTNDGRWTETEWNNDPAGYGMDAYHDVRFADSTNGASSITVTVTENRIVKSLEMVAAQTAYRIDGPGEVSVPTFSATGTAPYTFAAPLKLTTGGIDYAETTADQAILDPRGTIGAVTVPAAAGGTALLSFGDGSQSSVGTISVGSGKTLEIRNARSTASGGASVLLNGAVTAAADSKIVVSALEDCHVDLRQNSPDWCGKVEVRDGGFLHVNALFDAITATEEDPVWVHGANSTLSLYGNQVNNRFPGNGHVLVTDGGTLWLRGVNIIPQQESPYITVSNATLDVSNEKVTGNSHIHMSDVTLLGESTMTFTTTTAAWGSSGEPNQGGTVWGQINVGAGTSLVTRVSGNPNHLYFAVKGTAAHVNGTLNVAANAALRVSTSFFLPPRKAGEGTLIVEPGSVFGYKSEKKIFLDGGWLKINATANDRNVLNVLEAADGTGLDLTDDDACFGTASAASAITATAGTWMKLRFGTRRLTLGDYVVRWSEGGAPACDFRSDPNDLAARRYAVKKVADGVIVENRRFWVIVR